MYAHSWIRIFPGRQRPEASSDSTLEVHDDPDLSPPLSFAAASPSIVSSAVDVSDRPQGVLESGDRQLLYRHLVAALRRLVLDERPPPVSASGRANVT
jgi:hypothetical protein